MMRNYITAFGLITAAFFMCFPLALQAQEDSSPATENVARLTLLNPGVAYEAKTGKTNSLMLHAFLNSSFAVETDFFDGTDDIIWYVDPSLSAQYRFYYNLQKRMESGKRTAKNSANFIAPVYEGYLTKRPLDASESEYENRRVISVIGAVWGMQRNYAGRFSLDLYAGPGVGFGKTYDYGIQGSRNIKTGVTFSLLAQVNIGFWLGKK